MSELRIGDVRSRGCMWTLGPASEEANVNINLMIALLDAAYYKIPYESIYNLKKKRIPYWPQLYTKEELLNTSRNVPINDLIEANLITPTSQLQEHFFLTTKALKIFLRAKEIDIKLSKQEFHCCPCICQFF